MQYPWSRPGGSREPPHNTMESAEEMFRREYTEAMDTHHQQNVPKKSKRFRSAFTTDQVNFLEMEFQKFPYIGNTQRKEIANILDIPERAVKIWFQNRRMKEKKDIVGNPESDEQSNRNTDDSVNDEVINSTFSTSAINESSYLLPELAVIPSPSVNHVAQMDLTNFKPNSGGKTVPRKLNYYSDLISPFPEVSISRIPKPQPGGTHTSGNSQLKYRSSAEFSIDLCKKYKKIGVTDPQSKRADVSLQPLPATPPRLPLQGSSRKVEHQSSPEDLSCNKFTVTKIQTPSPPKNVDPPSPGLIPVYVNYPQPFLSAGNMLWNPVNVVPIMSTGVPTVNVPSIPPGPLPRSQEQSTVKKKCNCDCHVDDPPAAPTAAPTAAPPPETSSNSQAQYVITALPFQNYPKF